MCYRLYIYFKWKFIEIETNLPTRFSIYERTKKITFQHINRNFHNYNDEKKIIPYETKQKYLYKS